MSNTFNTINFLAASLLHLVIFPLLAIKRSKHPYVFSTNIKQFIVSNLPLIVPSRVDNPIRMEAVVISALIQDLGCVFGNDSQIKYEAAFSLELLQFPCVPNLFLIFGFVRAMGAKSLKLKFHTVVCNEPHQLQIFACLLRFNR